jgi:hypothetical protein
MDNGISALLSWQFLMFSIGVFTIVWIIRTIVEYIFPKADGSKFWEKLALPIMPPIVGIIAALIAKHYPYPDSITTVSGRIFFGMVTGILSGLAYQLVKGNLADKIRTILNTNNQPNYNSQSLPMPPQSSMPQGPSIPGTDGKGP